MWNSFSPSHLAVPNTSVTVLSGLARLRLSGTSCVRGLSCELHTGALSDGTALKETTGTCRIPEERFLQSVFQKLLLHRYMTGFLVLRVHTQ